MDGRVNFIVKAKGMKRALEEAGIEVRSVIEVFGMKSARKRKWSLLEAEPIYP